jgi:hypothetical protein
MALVSCALPGRRLIAALAPSLSEVERKPARESRKRVVIGSVLPMRRADPSVKRLLAGSELPPMGAASYAAGNAGLVVIGSSPARTPIEV